jgi:hypothetical protein
LLGAEELLGGRSCWDGGTAVGGGAAGGGGGGRNAMKTTMRSDLAKGSNVNLPLFHLVGSFPERLIF